MDALIESFKSAVEYWRNMADSLRSEKWRLDKRVEELESQVEELRAELKQIKNKKATSKRQ